MEDSKIPYVELNLELVNDDEMIRSFIDVTDHLQFRCKCDEWYKVSVILWKGENGENSWIGLKFRCPLCGREDYRKIYVDLSYISVDIIENLLMNIDFSEWNDKKDILMTLGFLRWDINTMMEGIAKENGLKVPNDDEIKERIELMDKNIERLSKKFNEKFSFNLMEIKEK